MYELRHIRISSFARVSMLLGVFTYLGFGIAAVVAYVLVRGVLAHSFVTSGKGGVTLLLLWLAGALFVLVVSYCIGLLTALFYNLFADWWGGIRFDLVTTAAAPQSMPAHPLAPSADHKKRPHKERHAENKAGIPAVSPAQSEGKELL